MAKNEVVKKETAQVPSAFIMQEGLKSEIDRSDILIPRILLMQLPSRLVAEDKATMSDIVHSTTEKIIGGKEKQISFIPLTHYKDVTKYEIEEGETRPKFKARLPWDAQTSKLDFYKIYSEIDDKTGKEIKVKYVKNLNFFVLLEEDMKDASALPCLLSFYSTSYQEGRKLITHWARCEKINRPPCIEMFNLGTKKEKGDNGPYAVFTLSNNKPTPEAYASEVNFWMNELNKNQFKIDDAELEAVTTSEPPPRSTTKSAQGTAQF